MTNNKNFNIYIFGANTPVGSFFYDELKKNKIIEYSKIFRFSRTRADDFHYFDLSKPELFKQYKKDKNIVLINFAPIWNLSKFLQYFYHKNSKFLDKIELIITCSSTSIITKKYAFNKFDKKLFLKLFYSENNIMKLSKNKKIDNIIVRPSMVYGSYNKLKDSNIEVIKKFLNVLPFIVLPKESGLRQPIHAYQLANVFLNLFIKFSNKTNKKINRFTLDIGGDEFISYEQMIRRVFEKNKSTSTRKKLRILFLPNQLFSLVFSPILLFSPKIYEALLRTMADLSGFKKSYEFSTLKKSKFPFK